MGVRVVWICHLEDWEEDAFVGTIGEGLIIDTVKFVFIHIFSPFPTQNIIVICSVYFSIFVNSYNHNIRFSSILSIYGKSSILFTLPYNFEGSFLLLSLFTEWLK